MFQDLVVKDVNPNDLSMPVVKSMVNEKFGKGAIPKGWAMRKPLKPEDGNGSGHLAIVYKIAC